VTDWGLPAALFVMLRAAVRDPEIVGLNVILMLQLAPAANELPHVSDDIEQVGSSEANLIWVSNGVIPAFLLLVARLHRSRSPDPRGQGGNALVRECSCQGS
jgi:hypothetical protein